MTVVLIAYHWHIPLGQVRLFQCGPLYRAWRGLPVCKPAMNNSYSEFGNWKTCRKP